MSFKKVMRISFFFPTWYVIWYCMCTLVYISIEMTDGRDLVSLKIKFGIIYVNSHLQLTYSVTGSIAIFDLHTPVTR